MGEQKLADREEKSEKIVYVKEAVDAWLPNPRLGAGRSSRLAIIITTCVNYGGLFLGLYAAFKVFTWGQDSWFGATPYNYVAVGILGISLVIWSASQIVSGIAQDVRAIRDKFDPPGDW